MTLIAKCLCGCGKDTSRKAKTGRIPVYATDACRVRALRKRKALSNLQIEANLEPITELRSISSITVTSTSTDEQIANSILVARSAAFALQRLGTSSRPELAWRCSKVGDAIIKTITEYFPER